nr:unnamed protein product [Spirometra erinaceieuropaei]
MLMDAYRDERSGIHIAYRTSGHLLNSRRMQASARLFTITVHDLLFAVDCAFNNISESDVDRSMELFAVGEHFARGTSLVGLLRTQRTNHPTTKTAVSTTAPSIKLRGVHDDAHPDHRCSTSPCRAVPPSIIAIPIISAETSVTTTTTTGRNAPDVSPTTTLTITLPHPAMWIRSQTVLIATAHSPRAPA